MEGEEMCDETATTTAMTAVQGQCAMHRLAAQPAAAARLALERRHVGHRRRLLAQRGLQIGESVR